ncbi:hypothetical protein DNTS_009053 [Danionella cerebrum]|uniref:RNA helicase n=1 Tax=Danionella cerebrum TaxID=2873325 RepID=A0A553N413_9TELE|nr:hypothetical protein DNTS_009053 [Danionella translucida]TRY60171.1 hypothetical protein DNTS_009053 [Danionella translucida]
MAQKRKKMQKRKKRGLEDEEEFQVAAGVKDDKTINRKPLMFPGSSECVSDVEPDTQDLVRAQNKKKKKSGGFQSMEDELMRIVLRFASGLSFPVFKGIMKKGYKVPTPIQRKDVVAMARTGSGKTASFLIPMFEKLKSPKAQSGARALILSPSRELALQTHKFARELGKFTRLKSALVLGGDSMDDQFAALHENPDIIIGTPGRLMHVIQQMNLKLQAVEYVVFDEADRLFELGFAEQLQEIIRRLPDSRQTLLFSATLPKLLVEFARAGLMEPLSFFSVRLDDKPALLLHLLRNLVKPQEQTVIFVATKHHVEYLRELLALQGVDCAYIYSALDQTARKINIGRFVLRKAMVLLVTDVAARGIDIPLLDNVINYNFPSKPKLFLHRVGRVARAGREGRAYSLVCPDELPYLYDLHLFLGRPVTLAHTQHTPGAECVLGSVPQTLLDEDGSQIISDHNNSLDLQNLLRVSQNSYQQYLRSRPAASAESIKRSKNTDVAGIAIHPLLRCGLEQTELDRLQMVDSIKGYKAKSTIFEINSNNKSSAGEVMRAKRSRDTHRVEKFTRARADLKMESPANREATSADLQEEEQDPEIQTVFSEVVGGKKRKREVKIDGVKSKKKRGSGKDEEFYIPYKPKDFDSERGLCLGSDGVTFQSQAADAVLDLMGDESTTLGQHKSLMKWDRKRKRFVHDTGKDGKGKIKTESGHVVTGKKKRKNFYEEWKKKYKIDDRDSDGESGVAGRRENSGGRRGRFASGSRSDFHAQPKRSGSGVRSELKNRDQILKQRRKKQKQQFVQSGGIKRKKQQQRQVREVMKGAFGRGGKKGKMRKRL